MVFSFKLEKIKNQVIILLTLCVCLASCSFGKQRPIDQLKELTEDIRLHHNDYSVSDWEKAYGQYQNIAKEMEKYRYTKDESEEIGRLEGECIGYFLKSAINSFEGVESEIKGFVHGLNKTIE